MSPHAVPVRERDLSPTHSSSSIDDSQNTRHQHCVNSSHLQPTHDDDIHDLVCVGFGPASLAIAVALHDALEQPRPALRTHQPKVRFLEKQDSFAWHAGMLLPGAKMQITFVKDLATLRNPRSEFTFINYLHQKGRLVDFTNLGTFLPQRIEYEDYMKWSAAAFADVVSYSEAVQSVSVGSKNPKTGAITQFAVTSHNQLTNTTTTLKTKHVVIATGGQPNIPASLPYPHPRVLHSSQYATNVPKLFPAASIQPQSIAVIGGGQSAAEVFNNLPSQFPNAKIHLILRGGALRPSDDSPFVNEIFNPERVDSIYSQEPSLRAETLAQDKATNYSVVRLELLEHIYSTLYSYKIQHGYDESLWPQRILPHRTILSTQDLGQGRLRLHMNNRTSEYLPTPNTSAPTSRSSSMTSISEPSSTTPANDTLDVDLLIVASGYKRNAHETLLSSLESYLPTTTQSSTPNSKWQIRRDYSVILDTPSQTSEEGYSPSLYPSSQMEKGSQEAGIWLQGCNEKTHGLSDSLLSILAVRGGEVVESIFGSN